ncbi:hypothetical protein B0H14DRAFT_2600110 [Mycena olivaceomarginata]|nr:hypothetical protein B0H14DRAFT_2600110 [Mycena olivaceomarginata]
MGGMPWERTIHARSGTPVHIIASPALPRDVGTRQNRQEIHQEKAERKQNEPTLKRSPASDRCVFVVCLRRRCWRSQCMGLKMGAEDEIADVKKARKHEEMWEVDTMKGPGLLEVHVTGVTTTLNRVPQSAVGWWLALPVYITYSGVSAMAIIVDRINRENSGPKNWGQDLIRPHGDLGPQLICRADITVISEIVYDILYLNGFVERISGHHSPLLADLETYVDRVNDNQLRGLYVWCRFNQNYRDIPQSVVTDLVAEARLQLSVSSYYMRVGDMNTALKHCEKSLSLGGNDDNRRHRALRNMAVIKNSTGDFHEALALAGQAQNVAGKIGNFHGKTDAIHEEARAWIGLGNFAQGSPCAARPGNCLSPVVFSGLWRRTLEFDPARHMPSRELRVHMANHVYK